MDFLDFIISNKEIFLPWFVIVIGLSINVVLDIIY